MTTVANESTWSLATNESLVSAAIDPFEDQLETITRQTRYFYVFTLVFSALFVFGIAFNLLSIVSILNSKSFTPINTLILSLAFSDIAYTMSIPLFAAQLFAKSWPFGEFGCRVFYLIDMIGMNVSVLTITALSIERFIDVTSKLKNWKLFTQKSKLRAIILYIVLSWLFSFIFAFPFVTSVRLVKFNNVYTCGSTWNEQTTRNYFTLKLVTSFVIPYVLITISSSKLLIFLKGWRSGSSSTASSSFSVISTETTACATNRNTSSTSQSIPVLDILVSHAETAVSQISNERLGETRFQAVRGKLNRRSDSTKRFSSSAKYQKHVPTSRMHKSTSLVNKLSRLGVGENGVKKTSLTTTTDASSEVSSQNLASIVTSHSGLGSTIAVSNDLNSFAQLESPNEEKPMIDLLAPRPPDSIRFIARPKAAAESRQSPILQIKSKTDLALRQPSGKFFNAQKKRSQTLANFALRRASMPYIQAKRTSNATVLASVMETTTTTQLQPAGYSYIYSVKRKAIRLVLIIILSFFIQWTPLWLFHILMLYIDINISLEHLHLTNIIVSILAYSNSVANPTLYMLVTYNFKEFYKTKFKRRLLPRSRSNISATLHKGFK